MATGWMPGGISATLGGSIDWDTDNIKCVMMLDTYVFAASDTNLDDVSASAAANGTSGNLTITITNGVIDVADFSITPDTAQDVDALYFYKDTGTPSTSTLLWYADSTKVSNLPLTTDGGVVNITIDNGANKFFQVTPVLS